ADRGAEAAARFPDSLRMFCSFGITGTANAAAPARFPKGVCVATEDRSSGRRHVAGRERGRAPEPRVRNAVPASPLLDVHDIFKAAGEAPYAWRFDTDALIWGDNA